MAPHPHTAGAADEDDVFIVRVAKVTRKLSQKPSQKPRCRLAQLPTELLHSICEAVSEYASDGERFRDHPDDLVQLSRTCRRMYLVVQHTLYRDITAGRTEEEDICRVDIGGLIRTLFRKRSLGRLIRHIDLDLFDHTGRGSNKEYLVYGKIKTWYLSRAIGRFFDAVGVFISTPNASTNTSSIDIGNWCRRSAIPILLLLAMAPNTTSLRLHVPHDWQPENLDHILRTTKRYIKSGLNFHNLTTLQLRFHRPHPSPTALPAKVFNALFASTANLTSLELRDYPTLGQHDLILPRSLTSLVLIDMHVTSVALEEITKTMCPHLTRLCVYSYHNGQGDAEVDWLAGHRLRLLAGTPAVAGRLRTLALCSTVLHPGLVNSGGVEMGNFAELRVLGIRYAFYGHGRGGERNLLVNLVRECPSLRGLLVAGAFRISEDALMRFGKAVAQKRFPSLEMVKLVCRAEFWKDLKHIVTKTARDLFWEGGVALVLGIHEYEGTAGLVEEMEAEMAGDD